MNYQRHYDLLIERARDRVLSGYSERHHIIPRCVGGGDEKLNLAANIGRKSDRGTWDSAFLDTPGYKQQQSRKMIEVWARRRAGDLPMPFHAPVGG